LTNQADSVALPERTLLRLIERSLDDDKAVDPVTIDLEGKTAFADAMIVASGTSQRHIAAMADKLLERLKAAGYRDVTAEGGGGEADWVLIDTGDVIVHLFKPETRDFYNLEKLWMAPVREPTEPKRALG
jgi:ribosome-associated protein